MGPIVISCMVPNNPTIFEEKTKSGAVARDRTVDLVINSHTLYRLSYNGLFCVNNPRYIKLSLDILKTEIWTKCS